MHDPVEKRPAYFHKVHPRVYTRPLLSVSPCFLLLRGKEEEGTKLPLNDFYTTMVIFKPINSRLRINHFLLPTSSTYFHSYFLARSRVLYCTRKHPISSRRDYLHRQPRSILNSSSFHKNHVPNHSFTSVPGDENLG